MAGEQQATLTVAVPAGAKPTAMALEVKGTDTAGVTSTLCLQLEPAKTGGLKVLSMLAPPTKTSKNLEIILDASGSMKALLGKKSRWQTALDTLQDVLGKLPDDFNVGLRMYRPSRAVHVAEDLHRHPVARAGQEAGPCRHHEDGLDLQAEG